MSEKQEVAYDSTADTLKHIRLVSEHIDLFCMQMRMRAIYHDESKLNSPEKEIFDKYTPLIRDLKYGSDEYKNCLKEMDVALKHHYMYNSHHPEYYKNGVDGMNLFDVVEMYCDWSAAVSRNKDGNILKSIDIGEKKFNMTPQLASIFRNTVNFLYGDIEEVPTVSSPSGTKVTPEE